MIIKVTWRWNVTTVFTRGEFLRRGGGDGVSSFADLSLSFFLSLTLHLKHPMHTRFMTSEAGKSRSTCRFFRGSCRRDKTTHQFTAKETMRARVRQLKHASLFSCLIVSTILRSRARLLTLLWTLYINNLVAETSEHLFEENRFCKISDITNSVKYIKTRI